MDTLAQRIRRFGSPDVIELESISLAEPSVNELLVRIRAAGVGPWDALIRAGKSAFPQALPLTLGSDFAGVVLDPGSAGSSFAVGEEVYGITSARFTGAYAHHAIVDVDRIARKPKSLGFVAAASIPVVSVTAWKMLFEVGRLEVGQRVLIHGAAGSVGAFAVQLAVSAGAEVIALARESDRDYLASLGVEAIHIYDAAPFEYRVKPVDLVLDTIGGEILERSFRVLERGGTLVSIVERPDEKEAAKLGIRAEFFVVDVRTADLHNVATRIDRGGLKANVGLTLPLTEARQAHVLLERQVSGLRGKIVLSVDAADNE
jgi:NADPH:quinone reductase-like Zn-dependent oxidoreductase